MKNYSRNENIKMSIIRRQYNMHGTLLIVRRGNIKIMAINLMTSRAASTSNSPFAAPR